MTPLIDRALLLIAQAALPRADRESMAGDLEEEYERLRDATGRAAAARWLMSETARNAAYALGRAVPRVDAGNWAPNLLQDVRYGARLLRRTPGFTATIVITLALGVGANALVFSVVNGLLLRPLPIERPDRVVFVQSGSIPAQSYPNYADLRDRNRTFDGLIGYRISPMSVDAVRRWGYLATGNYFDVLGVRPAAGRFFHAEDDTHPGGAPVVVLSHDEWTGRYGGDPRAVGSTIRVNAQPYTIIGVAPRGFIGIERFYRPAMWVPMSMQAQIEPGNPWLDRRMTFNVWVAGRLAANVTAAEAQANLNAIMAQLARDYPGPNRGLAITLTNPGLVGSVLGTPVRAFTFAVQALAVLVLLAGCANLASLVAARGSDRRRELAVRIAIGAGRGRLLRQLLTESLLLSLAGGLAGALLAWTLAATVSAWRAPVDLPVQFDVGVDPRVLLFAFAMAAAAGVLFGVAPAIYAVRTDANAALKGSTEATTRRRWSTREGLVALQMVLCVVLVTACLLSVRGLQRAVTLPLGFDPRHVTVASFDLGLAGYDPARAEAFQRRVLDAVRQLPGVESAAYSNSVPLSVDQSRNTVTERAGTLRSRSDERRAVTYQVSPEFFRTLGIRMMAGRDFDWRDRRGSTHVAIVNQAFARDVLRTADPVGRQFHFGAGGPAIEVVGLVEDGKYETLTERPTPAVFSPILQWHQATTVLSVRTRNGGPDVADLRRVVAAADASLPVYDARPLHEMLGLALFPSRVAAVALGAFGVLALSLAVTGLFGLVSYAVARREREIGIRIAIGANAPAVLRAILGRTAVLVAAGAVIGTGLSRLLGRLLSSIVYTASPDDPLVLAGVAAVMLAVGLLSCWVPAARALRISPTVALKAD
jgi:predicted permease